LRRELKNRKIGKIGGKVDLCISAFFLLPQRDGRQRGGEKEERENELLQKILGQGDKVRGRKEGKRKTTGRGGVNFWKSNTDIE
jgi:hypothetical protein